MKNYFGRTALIAISALCLFAPASLADKQTGLIKGVATRLIDGGSGDQTFNATYQATDPAKLGGDYNMGALVTSGGAEPDYVHFGGLNWPCLGTGELGTGGFLYSASRVECLVEVPSGILKIVNGRAENPNLDITFLNVQRGRYETGIRQALFHVGTYGPTGAQWDVFRCEVGARNPDEGYSEPVIKKVALVWSGFKGLNKMYLTRPLITEFYVVSGKKQRPGPNINYVPSGYNTTGGPDAYFNFEVNGTNLTP